MAIAKAGEVVFVATEGGIFGGKLEFERAELSINDLPHDLVGGHGGCQVVSGARSKLLQDDRRGGEGTFFVARLCPLSIGGRARLE